MGGLNCTTCDDDTPNLKLYESQVVAALPFTFPKTKSHFPDSSIARQVSDTPLLNEVVKLVLQQQLQVPLKQEGEVGVQLPAFEIPRSSMTYFGEWLSGAPHGKGKVFPNNGAYFEGEFKEGEANCADGLFVYPDGTSYRGSIRNSKAHGKGTLVYKDKVMVYRGEWVNDKPNGFGREQFKDGSNFQGAFENGLKNGKGKFAWADGKTYQGTFFQGSIHGQGVFTSPSGLIYRGTFVRNNKQGYGREQTGNGQYVGLFRQGKRSGKGEFRYKDGKTYDGEFLNGRPHGEGVLALPNGQHISGVWRDGQNVLVHQFPRTVSRKHTAIEQCVDI